MANNVLAGFTVIKEMVQGQLHNWKSQLSPGNIRFIKQRYL
jgi:hypothetical protein